MHASMAFNTLYQLVQTLECSVANFCQLVLEQEKLVSRAGVKDIPVLQSRQMR